MWKNLGCHRLLEELKNGLVWAYTPGPPLLLGNSAFREVKIATSLVELGNTSLRSQGNSSPPGGLSALLKNSVP